VGALNAILAEEYKMHTVYGENAIPTL